MLRRHHGAIVWTLVVTMILSPELVCAQPPAETPVAAAKPKPDLDYVTPDAVAGVVAYPRAVLTAPQMEMLPVEVLSAAGKKELGIDPVEIEQAIVIAEPPAGGPPGAAVVLKLTNPISGEILGPVWRNTTADTLDGRPYRKAKGPMDPCIYQPDDRTIIVGTDGLLRKMVANDAAPKEGKLKTMLGRAGSSDLLGVVLIEPLRPLIGPAMSMAPLPPQMAKVRDVPNLVNYVAAKVNLSNSGGMTLIVRANNEADAEKLAGIVDDLMEMGQQAFMAEVAKQEASRDAIEQAQAKYAKRIGTRMMDVLRPVRKGATLTLSYSGNGGNSGMSQVAVIGLLIGMLLPAVQAAREAGRRAQLSNNLKQIILAMFNYEATKGHFPPQASCDAQGKPLLSWRVAILPYIEEQALYNRFHLDEPWDSPNNRPLIAMMPKLYSNPSSAASRPGAANYLAVCGPGLMFDGTKGRKLAEITDGTSNTIAVVEADDSRAVEWTRPQDWDFDAEHPLAGLGHAHPSGFNAAFADGSVRMISAGINPKVFHAMLTVAGGEALNGTGE